MIALIRYKATFFVLVAVLWSACASNATAKSKKKLPNCLKSIVIFYKAPEAGVDEQPFPIGTGFAVNYKGKTYLATNFNIIPRSFTPSIKTLDAKNVPYTKILMAKDRRDVVLFEVDKSKMGDVNIVPLDAVDDLTSEVELGEKTISLGCRSNWETITSSAGKIEAIGPINLEIKTTVSYNMNGGPIFSAETGKVLGVVAIMRQPDNESKKLKNCLATRLDTIKELAPFDSEMYQTDLTMLTTQKARLAAIKERYEKYVSRLDELMKEIKDGYGTKHKPINAFKTSYENDVRKIKAVVASGRTGAEKFKLQYFKKLYQKDLESIKTVLEKFLTLDKSVEKLEKANKAALKKGKFKNSLLERSKL